MSKKLKIPDPKIGDVFSRLTIIDDKPIIGPHGKEFKCQCSCEKKTIKYVRKDSLTSSNIKGCGCLIGRTSFHRKLTYPDPVPGERFTRLVVLNKVPNDTRGRFSCQCDCGKIKNVFKKHLLKGTVRSCGCYSSEVTRIRLSLPEGVAAFKALIRGYKQSASLRGFDWKLTENEFSNLVSSNCFYCNRPPSNVKFMASGTGNLFYSGIDRLDNNVGYINTNCVPACKFCNLAKGTLKFEQFKHRMKEIINNFSSWENLTRHEIFTKYFG